MPTQREIEDDYTAHALELIAVANALAEQADAELVRLGRDLRALLADDLPAMSRSDLLRRFREIEGAIEERFAAIAALQAMRSAELVEIEAEFARRASEFTRAASATALAVAGGRVLVMGVPVARQWAFAGSAFAFRVLGEVRNAVAAGAASPAIVEAVLGAGRRPVASAPARRDTPRARVIAPAPGTGGLLGPARRHARGLVDAMVQSAGNDGRVVVMRANGVQAVKWHAVLDSKVCPECAMRAGKLWDLDGKPIGHAMPMGVRPPAHYWCRCILLPMRYRNGVPEDGGPEVNRFDEWLDQRSEAEQDRLLGKGRARLFRDGVITLADLINQNGRLLSLADLRASIARR